MEIDFTFVGENGEKLDFVKELRLEGITFEEMFYRVVAENKKILEKLKNRFGDIVWNQEKEAFLTKEENLWLRLNQLFVNLKKS